MPARYPLTPFLAARSLYIAALADFQLTDEAVKAEAPAPAHDADDEVFDAWADAIEAAQTKHGWHESRAILRHAACTLVAEAGAELARRDPRRWAELDDVARDMWTWASDPEHPKFGRCHDRVLALALKMQTASPDKVAA